MIRKPFYTVLWIALAAGILAAVLLPIKALIYHSPDDAFFYLKTAWNFAAGYGSTFDGMNPTNGYHPLWFLVLAGMFFAGEGFGAATAETMYRVSFVLQWVMFAGTVYYAAKAITGSVSRDGMGNPDLSGEAAGGRDVTTHAFLLGLLIYYLVFIRVVGSEAQISVFVFSGYLYIKTREWNRGMPQFLGKSALLALLFLARIDYISTLVPAVFFGDVLTSPRGYRLKTAFFLAAAAGATAATYFFINYMEFGHLLTVSASWKSEFPRFLLFSNIPWYLEGNPVQFVRAVAAIAVCAWYAVRVFGQRADAAPLDLFLAWAAAGAVLFMLQTMSFNAHKIREWYTSMPVFIAVLIAVRYSLRLRRIPHWATSTLAAVGLAFLIGAGLLISKWDTNYDFARKLERELGTTQPVMIVDCAGIVGYFSGVPVINGDGLVNSFAYLETVRRGQLRQWLAARGVPYYASYSLARPDSLDGAYIDWAVTGFGGMDFVFDSSQTVMRAPFSIENIRFRSTGEWMVFKLDNTLPEN